MAESNTLSDLREWAPLTDLLNKIPSKPNLNIFSEEVKITCVDILAEFIALGTNYGMAYWYGRKTKDLKRLRCENSNISITSIKVLSTVDYMLACGSTSGNISIFQIPKAHPDWIPEKLKPKNKSVERYTVSELHKSAITALEWSKNGMKLFSGDKDGTVVLTEIDFYMHICKSLEILNESYEVVQLSYNNPKLVVSTTYRSIICEKADKWNVMQVGRRDRKILGAFGGLIQQNRLNPKDAVIYCTRPGLRLWVSDDQGVVQKTLVFKEILKKECAEVPILNPVSEHVKSQPLKDVNFSVILPFGENLLVTYNSNLIYILDVKNMRLLSKISRLRRVLDVACHKDEIFILEEDRSLIRISTKPEIDYDDVNISPKEATFLSSSIKDTSSRLPPSGILSVIPPVIGQTLTSSISEHTDVELIMNAEEALEAPISPPDVQPIKRFDHIEVDDSTEILYKPKKQKKRKKNAKDQNVESAIELADSTEGNINITKPTLMSFSMIGQLPDLRSPQSILSSVEQKEKMLESFLSYKKPAKNAVNVTDLSKESSVKELLVDPYMENKDEIVSSTENKNIPIVQKDQTSKFEEGTGSEQFTIEKQISDVNVFNGSKILDNISTPQSSQPLEVGNKENNFDCLVATEKDSNIFESVKDNIGDEKVLTLQNGQTPLSIEKAKSSKTSVLRKQNSDKGITDEIDFGGLIDIDKILILQESRTSEYKENLKTPISKRKVMKKSQTSVMNDCASLFDIEEKNQMSDKFDNLSISDYSTLSKKKTNEGSKTRAIPIMSKSTEMPACIDVPNGWQVPSVDERTSSDLLLKDWVII